MSKNPLQKFFRQPAIYFPLPSKGQNYAPGVLDLPANGEVPIYPTHHDPIGLRSKQLHTTSRRNDPLREEDRTSRILRQNLHRRIGNNLIDVRGGYTKLGWPKGHPFFFLYKVNYYL